MIGAARVNGQVMRASNPTRPIVYPQAGGQYAAIWSDAFEVLGGGSAGGGKSWFLVLDALGLQYQYKLLGKPAYHCRDYRAVLFRRESTQLDRLISEAKKYYIPLGFKYVGGRQGEPGPCFEHPLYGSKIFMCHLQHEDDKESHQGQEYQYIGFDELTHFTVTQYLYLFSRARSTIPGVYPRVRSTTNPTGEGLWWVRKRFVDKWPPGTKRWFLPPENPERDPRGKHVKEGTKDALSRVFIPFWLNENKILVDNDPGYASRMKAMGKQMEKALLGGDWYAFGGDLFPDFDRHEEGVDPFPIREGWRIVGSIDPGYSSACSFGMTAADYRGNYYRLCTYYEELRSPEKHAKAIYEMIRTFPWTGGRFPDRIVVDPSAFAKRDKFSVIETEKTFADVFMAHGLLLEPATNDRINGWWNWKSLMPKKWFYFKGLNDPLLDEMAAAVGDERCPEDIKGRGNDPTVKDHALDENRYGLMAIVTPSEPEQQDEGWEAKWIKGAVRKDEAGWYPGRG